MAKNVTVSLTTPMAWGDSPITEVVLREPKLRDYMSIGEPYITTKTADGTIVPIENTDAILQYLKECMVEPMGAAKLLDFMSLTDAMRLKDAVLTFFADARAAGLRTEPRSSSAPSVGSPLESSPTPA